MWETIKSVILRLFGMKTTQTDAQTRKIADWARVYEEAEEINFTAIIAGKLAALAVTDSAMTVTGDNARADYINGIVQSQIAVYAQKIISGALGYGGIALVPYYTDGKIYVDIVPQSRFFAVESRADDIIRSIMLSDYIVRDGKKYARWTEYALDGNTCVIRNCATINNNPAALNILPEWAGIAEEIRVPGCDRLLIGYLRCPQDNRRPDSYDGVPITYGCDKIIAEIQTTLAEEAGEYRLKRSFVGVDETLFGPDDRLPESGLFKTFNNPSADAEMWHEYSPEIRSAAYSARVQELFELLEKAIGASKGILTAPEAVATATEVRRAQHDTWALVGNIRKAAEKAIDNAVYAINVLCNYYGLTPQGDYTIQYDWDMSMLEDSGETWQQLKDGRSMGIRSKAELRAWQTGETLEEAQAMIDEIEASEPVMQDLIGHAQ